MPAFFSHVEVPPSVVDDSASTDRSALAGCLNYDRSALARPPRHSWNLEQRVALCVLKRWFSPNHKDMHPVFNAHYAPSIQQQNPGHHIAQTTLLAQLRDMENDGENNEAWRSVVLETEFGDPHSYFKNTRQDLEKTATNVGVALIRGWEDKHRISARSGRGRISKTRKRKRGGNVEGVLGFVMNDSEEDEPCTPSKRRYGLLTPPTTMRASVQAIRSHQIPKRKPQVAQLITPEPFDYNYRFLPPNLGFRFWDNKSHGLNTAEGFRAGAFVNCHGSIPSPPNRYDQVFRQQSNIHLQPLAEPSSYISVWEGILPAFHRGLRSSANAHVAMINLRAVYEQQLSGIPGLYPAAHAINQLEMVTKGNYRGRKEWLVWGEIKRAAVVACFTVEDFRRFIHSVPQIVPTLRLNEIENSTRADEYHRRLLESRLPISRASGKIVGRLLAFTGLPKSFVDFAARKIATSWKFLGYDNSQRWKSYLNGVYSGFNLQLATTHNALQIASNPIPSMRVSPKAMVTGDTFQDRRARIQSIMAGSLKDTVEPRMRIQRRQIDCTVGTVGTLEAETEINDFWVQRRRIESVLQRQAPSSS